jgi:hypothetical protein
MRLERVILIALSAGVLVAVAPEAQGKGGTPITACGQVVTTSAVLAQDLYCPGSSGVVVGAGGITVELNGHILRGDRSANHWGIDDTGGWDGVKVQNGVVRNFSIGVDAQNADKFSVSNLVASGNYYTGVSILTGTQGTIQSTTGDGNGTVGLFIRGNGGSIKASTADGNGFIGMDVEGVGTTARSSTADGNGDVGFDLGANVKLQSVTGNGNADYGISAIGDSVSILSSTFSGNGDLGIIITGNSETVNGNEASGNGFPGGASDLTGLGINVNGYTVPPAGSNTAHGNDDPAECSPASLC